MLQKPCDRCGKEKSDAFTHCPTCRRDLNEVRRVEDGLLLFEGSRIDAAKYLDISDRTLRTYLSKFPELIKWKDVTPPTNGRRGCSDERRKIDDFLIDNCVYDDDKIHLVEDLIGATINSFDYKLANKANRKKLVENIENHIKGLL